MAAYQGPLQAQLELQRVSPEKGLSQAEVAQRLEKFGPNRLQEEQKVPLWLRFLKQFQDYMTLILVVAAVVSGFLGDWTEAIVILAIVIVNAILGVRQEGQAEAAVAALQRLSSPQARVLRDGQQQMVNSEELVPGDIVILEAGDVVPADLRLIDSVNLQVEEASLTGESLPVEKSARFQTEEELGIGDRENSLFSSTNVTYGRGRAVVVATGLETEIGHIAQRLEAIGEQQTPLQQNLNKLGRILGTLCLAVCALVFVIGILRRGELLPTFMTAVALAVAAIPEGLNVVVTIVLARGMKKLADRNAIVKKLLAVETLGSVNVICSDKTGTLTQNEMTVKQLFVDEHDFDVEGVGYLPKGEVSLAGETLPKKDARLQRLLEIALLCNSAELQGEGEKIQMLGDPTEGCLLTLGLKQGVRRDDLVQEHPFVGELPFDSDRKMMTVVHDGFAEGRLALTKGAPDVLLARCKYERDLLGEVRPLSPERRQAILDQNAAYAHRALRVLAFAYRHIEPEQAIDLSLEKELVFAGLVGMIDPARPEAREAIKLCHQAGIRCVMITGDHRDTAVAIAKDLGLMQAGEEALTGMELEAMDDQELAARVDKVAVFARVSPEHKVRIVAALRSHDHICSMTGDGVNDAPALKQADIGVAMGITGTEVAKSSADMILTDDQFDTIVTAVSEGRVIFANIRKFVGFLLSCNVGEILVIFLATLILGPSFSPLTAIQLLWLNLVTDSFPALALGVEQAEGDIMQQPPRHRGESIINRPMVVQIVTQALAIFLAVFGAFTVGRYFNPDLLQGTPVANFTFLPQAGAHPSPGAETYAFTTLILAELWRAYACRTERQSVFRAGLFSNKAMVQATGAALCLLLAVLYIPFLQTLFETTGPGLIDWAVMLPLSLVPFFVGELVKKIYYRRHQQA